MAGDVGDGGEKVPLIEPSSIDRVVQTRRELPEPANGFRGR